MTKPTKWHVHPANTQISLGIHPVWSVFIIHMTKAWVLSYPLSAQRKLWSDWVDAQADLSLRWERSHFVGFIMWRLISSASNKQQDIKYLCLTAVQRSCNFINTQIKAFCDFQNKLILL